MVDDIAAFYKGLNRQNILNPILYLLYYFFKGLVWVTQRVYYSRVTVVNKERGRFNNPCIVVSNHPSTLLDPLNTAVEIQTEVFFLANASLFKYRFTDWLFNQLYCIPVERDKDTGGRPLNNAESFERSTKHLAGGGCLYVAPEGYSYVYRRLQKIRTGTARIAFAAERANNFQLGLTILPVGLNYSNPAKFRSRLLTIFGEPIRVADFQEDWETDEVEAVKKLTLHLKTRLQELTLDTADDDEDRLLAHLEEMSQNEHPLPPPDQLKRSQTLLSAWHQWRERKPLEFRAFQQQVFGYFEKLKASNLTDRALSGNERPSLWSLILLFPAFLYGGLSHFFPVFFTKKLSGWLNKDIHWEATYKYVIGLVFYLLFMGLQIGLAGKLVVATNTAPWLTWLYVLSIVPAGLVAEWWLKQWKGWSENRRLKVFNKNNPAALAGLLKERAEVMQHRSSGV